MIAVFARINHPEGWGFPVYKEGSPPTSATAHGYVVVAVRYTKEETLEAVKSKLMKYPNGFEGIVKEKNNLYGEGFLGTWFGGQFDYLFSVPDADEVLWPGVHVGGQYQCRGDNRFVGLYDANEILKMRDESDSGDLD